MKFGRYAGEVRELPFEAARDLVAAGRAEKVDFDARESQTQMLDNAASRGPAPSAVQVRAPFRRKVKRTSRA